MIKSGGVIYHNGYCRRRLKVLAMQWLVCHVFSNLSQYGCHYLQILPEFFEPALDGMDFLELKRAKSNAGTTVSRRERVQESVSKHVMLYS